MKRARIILIVLIILTLIATTVSNNIGVYTSLGILILAGIKFIGVSFFFMDLKRAHPFWKGITLVFLLVFTTILLVIV